MKVNKDMGIKLLPRKSAKLAACSICGHVLREGEIIVCNQCLDDRRY